jgi:hypothetical protein
VRDLFVRPTSPFRRAAEITGADRCDRVLDQLRRRSDLTDLNRLLRHGLRRIAIPNTDLRDRLATAPVTEAAIGEAFADYVANAIENVALHETDALRLALANSTFESIFANDGIFVDDCVGGGETYVTLSILSRLYRNELPRLYAISSHLTGAIKQWRAPIRVASERGPVIENLPWLADAVWEWRQGWYIRKPFTSYGDVSPEESEFVARVVSSFAPSERRTATAALVTLADGSRLGFAEALEAELGIAPGHLTRDTETYPHHSSGAPPRS